MSEPFYVGYYRRFFAYILYFRYKLADACKTAGRDAKPYAGTSPGQVHPYAEPYAKAWHTFA